MTILQLVSVRDLAVEAFNAPMCVPHVGAAIRGFTDEINRAHDNNPMYKHPSDYELHRMGTFNDETGEFTTEQSRLVRGEDVKTRE